MPLIFQHRIYRSDLQHNPDVLYIFGDNEARKGLGGQARECRGEPNAVGIATKSLPSRNNDAFWSDDNYDHNITVLSQDLAPVIEHLREGGIAVFPSDGIGTGLSELPKRAPKTFEFIRQQTLMMKSL
ncbi:MAG: hypothetical protein ACPGVT_11020 [Maricaulaceae bacterium]